MTNKLTKAQEEVMRWLSGGWSTQVAYGNVVEINGQQKYRLATLNALEKLGLIKKDTDNTWVAVKSVREAG